MAHVDSAQDCLRRLLANLPKGVLKRVKQKNTLPQIVKIWVGLTFMLLFFLLLIKPQMNGFWIDQDSALQNSLAL